MYTQTRNIALHSTTIPRASKIIPSDLYTRFICEPYRERWEKQSLGHQHKVALGDEWLWCVRRCCFPSHTGCRRAINCSWIMDFQRHNDPRVPLLTTSVRYTSTNRILLTFICCSGWDDNIFVCNKTQISFCDCQKRFSSSCSKIDQDKHQIKLNLNKTCKSV